MRPNEIHMHACMHMGCCMHASRGVAVNSAGSQGVCEFSRFGRHRDKGIIVFNLLVLVFLFFDLDFGYLAPAFLADPMGAIVGRCVPSAKWIGDKTVSRV